MCKKNSLLTRRMSRKMYSTFEINQAHEQLIDCHSCSGKERNRCQKSFRRTNKGTDSHQIPERKLKNVPYTRLTDSNLHGQLLRRQGFKGELTGKIISDRKQSKITPIIYGRTRDRYREQIHE